MRAASLFLCVLVGCATSPRSRDAAAPDPRDPGDPQDPAAQERQASRDTCPENAYLRFREIDKHGSETIYALHCGGWRIHEPDVPRLCFDKYIPSDAEDLITGEHWPIEPAQAGVVWQVARQSRWRTWETCAGEGNHPRWEVEIDDGDMTVLRVFCSGQLPPGWRTTLDALESLKSAVEPERYDYNGDEWRDELGVY